MYIKSLELENYRNYKSLKLSFDKGTTILYGDNAQGKTNILEAIYVSATTKSHKGSKDREIINFESEEGHIKTIFEKDALDYRIDMHLRKSKSKGIAVNCEKLKKAAELMGLLNVVFFSPEDLNIIKDGPSYRRRFVDMELCQLDQFYIYNLSNYNKIIEQRNKLLKDIYFNPSLRETLTIWDTQLESYGSKIIERREQFTEQLNDIMREIHFKLSGNLEEIKIVYEPNVKFDKIGEALHREQERDIRSKMTSVGPHRDDFAFYVNGIDIRKYGSQGQQRTAALSLKLAEIELIKKITKDVPVLLLDDVLSELDSNRQNYLLNCIGDIQTIITCTGLDEFVNNRFALNKVYKIVAGSVEES
ncbi:MAG: DNA replication/repair protein RecF [Lachnospiraceae bacterium]|nr:DNA replication/repair protein RecF [Lachnospiraceae bacterium]